MKKRFGVLLSMLLAAVLIMSGCSERQWKELEEKGKLHKVEDAIVMIPSEQHERPELKTESPKQKPEVVRGLSGSWEHMEYPDHYHLIIEQTSLDRHTVTIEAIRGEAAQIAVATVEDVRIVDGYAEFDYEDSFGNKGTVWLSELDGQIGLQIEHLPDQPGDWGILTAAGQYRRADAAP